MASLERQAARIVWKQFGLADAAPPAGRGLKSKAVIYYPRGCVEDFVFLAVQDSSIGDLVTDYLTDF